MSRYPNLHEVRLIPTKKDIAFVEFVDEGSAGVAKDALHNYKLDGENKIKVRCHFSVFVVDYRLLTNLVFLIDHLRQEVGEPCISFPRFCSTINPSSNFEILKSNKAMWELVKTDIGSCAGGRQRFAKPTDLAS